MLACVSIVSSLVKAYLFLKSMEGLSSCINLSHLDLSENWYEQKSNKT